MPAQDARRGGRRAAPYTFPDMVCRKFRQRPEPLLWVGMRERDDPHCAALHAPAELAGLSSLHRALTESERVLLAADCGRIRGQTGLLRLATVGEVDARLEGGNWTVTRDIGEVYEAPLAAIEGGEGLDGVGRAPRNLEAGIDSPPDAAEACGCTSRDGFSDPAAVGERMLRRDRCGSLRSPNPTPGLVGPLVSDKGRCMMRTMPRTLSGMCRSSGLAILLLLAAAWLAGCDEPAGEYLPASSIARKGFVRDHQSISELQGVQGGPVRLWGFVDHGNLYGDGRAKRVLAEWWSGDGPDADTWRFDLKAEADDPVGRSFAVLVPNDAGREDLLERFVADARARSTTKVFVTGRLFKFHAPTQTVDLTGLYLQLRSSQDIRLDRPDGN